MAKIPYKSYFPEKSDSKTVAAFRQSALWKVKGIDWAKVKGASWRIPLLHSHLKPIRFSFFQ